MFSNYREKISFQIKDKQARKREEWYSWSHRYRKRFLAAALVVCLTGCGVQNTTEESPGSADKLSSETEESSKPVDALSSEAGGNPKTPEIPYADQIDTIVQNKDIWCFTIPEHEGEEYFGPNESEYYYWITDMDQNGYLEVISSSTTGNGGYFDNCYYEVSPDGKTLTELKTDESEDAPAADLWYTGEYSRGYYDEKTGIYHYPQDDHTHGSAVDTSDAQLDTVLADGAVTINTISFIESMGKGENIVVKYYAGDKEEKLGAVKEPLDEKAEGIEDARKQAEEYSKQLAELYEQYYEGMQEFTVTSHSFCSIDEKEWEEESEISLVSDEILRERVEKSWNSFGIHFPNENAGDNPFFPETATEDAEVCYLLYTLSEGKATMQMREELRGEDSVLYQVVCGDPREVSNREEPTSEKEEKRAVKKVLKNTYFYLWVTDTQIYYISRFYSEEDDFGLDPESDEYIDEVYQDYQKARLVFYHEIPEYARLVCQEEEMEDVLEEDALGYHQWIEKHGEDIRCYRSYYSKGEDYEGNRILQFVWKRGEGLIGMSYAPRAGGGGGKIFWKEAYLEQKDVGFSIDNDTED